jgi:dTDP-4-amino-4,6-dideoxy-D-galactose acyltransferase
MNIRKLDWDSEFFGMKIGKIVIDNDWDFDPVSFSQEAADEKYELVYIFKYQEMLPWDKVIKAKIELIDIQLTMVKKFNTAEYCNIPYEFRTVLTASERNECYKIAEEISVVSRFFKEERIGISKTKELYRKWIDNSLNHNFSDGLFLYKESESISGIHLIKTDNTNKIGYCTLIGVDQRHKKMGVGRKLWLQSFGFWANESNVENIKAPVSLQNPDSVNFHLRLGFSKIEETKFIYHFKM